MSNNPLGTRQVPLIARQPTQFRVLSKVLPSWRTPHPPVSALDRDGQSALLCRDPYYKSTRDVSQMLFTFLPHLLHNL